LRVIEIIGVPFDLCGRRVGTRLGPAALRLAGLQEALEAIGCDVLDHGDMPSVTARTAPGGLRNFEPLVSTLATLKRQTTDALRAGRQPLVLGGDHSIAIGSVAAALHVHGPDLAVLWLDAHADLNTPSTSPSGNVHGMPLAALLGATDDSEGRPGEDWRRLLQEIVGDVPLRHERVSWLGLREIDPGEITRLKSLAGAFPITMQDVDRQGLIGQIEKLDLWLRRFNATKLWISFDVDALDPFEAPGTGTAVRGGFTYREAHLLAEMLRELLDEPGCPYQLAGMDLVETNPLQDRHNETARVAVEWVASLFGKTILGGR
jgi:arginase